MKKISASGITRTAIGAFSLVALLAGASSAHAATPTVSIVSVSPSTTITVGTPVTFSVATSGFIDPYYSLSDAFIGGSLGSSDLNSAGEFSWTSFNNDVGSHVVTVTAHDTAGDVATGSVTLTVTNASAAPTVTTTPAVVVCTQGETYDPATGQACTEFTAPAVTTSVVSPAVPVTPVIITTTVPADTFTQELTIASTGSQVTALQELLTAQGDFTGSITGYYGAETKAAVVKFQAAHSISQLGIVGPSTRIALNALETPTTVLGDSTANTTDAASTASAPTVAEIQSEVQSIETELTQVESQLSGL